MSVPLPVCLPACLPACLSARLPAYMSVCLTACLRARVRAGLQRLWLNAMFVYTYVYTRSFVPCITQTMGVAMSFVYTGTDNSKKPKDVLKKHLQLCAPCTPRQPIHEQ